MMKRGLGVIGSIALCGTLAAALQTEGAKAQGIPSDATALYAKIQASLALIEARDGKAFAFGTAFCIGSHNGIAYLLTNKHVVGNDPAPRVFLTSDPTSALHGAIDRTATLDAVVLAVQDATCTPLILSHAAPAVGTPVGIAGFPAFQLTLSDFDLQRLTPSFHAGTVSALPVGGLIEYDAQTDHGNSGSPLFDLGTGVVYGLVRAVNTGQTGALQNNLAISVPALTSFLDHSRAQVAYSPDATTSIDSGGQTAPAAVDKTATAAPSITTAATTSAGPNATDTAVPVNSSSAAPVVADGSAPGSVVAAIDQKCGSGVTGSILRSIKMAQAELFASDTLSAANDARSGIKAANFCAVSLSGPTTTACDQAASCSDARWTAVETEQLFSQQILRAALSRSKGEKDNDTENALRDEVATAAYLCSSPNILLSGQPYGVARNAVTQSIKLAQATDRFYGGRLFDIGAVRGCAAKLGIR